MHDLISIGDATVDHYVQIHEAEVRCNLNKTECMLCVEYGDKIPVDKLTNSVAGNSANNVVGGARLGLKSAIYVNVGSDASGKQIIEKLKLEGVSTRYAEVNEGMESNLSTVLTFKGERTIFVYHQDWKYKLPDLDLTKWVYFSSLSKSFTHSNLLNELILYLERTGARMLYSPGTYQIQAGVKKYPKLLTLTELFLVNKVEAKRILGYKVEDDIAIKKLLKSITELGPRMVAITDGKEGSFGYDGVKYYHLGVFPANLVEATGAGDAFATGCLAGLFYGRNLAEAMRWGAANGASVVEQIGPQTGLLTYNKMQENLKQNSKIVAKEI
ncbi:carbohydrate kinase family protein [Candidatus Daviesbacteria bacterium]|nr:carbohydrate kinase family protein [Candidatus Daviesbacteria bacterium]MBI4038562.1 carbohydrate kinase family protein [Candidatus Daviesbacteria bacterium]